MLRASAVCEQEGIPSASLTCEGFLTQLKATAVGMRMPSIPGALVPGRPDTQTDETLRRNVLDVTLGKVIEALTVDPVATQAVHEPDPRTPIFTGGFAEINRRFVLEGWSDGLPIVPPTPSRVEAFLACTARNRDEILGVPLPDRREATVHSVAVNGVMAGCRPEYMPILVALAAAACDPQYGVEHSGNTPGSETLILLNGPIIKQLGFNYAQGAMRDGFQPNTSIGRFWRLYLQNVAGFRLHETDKATYGGTWRVVVAENEDVLAKIGWEPNSVAMGFAAGDDTVTISRFTGGEPLVSVAGTTPEELLPYIADQVEKSISWHLMFTVGARSCTLRPLVLLSPILAETIARAGWSKRDVKQYLFAHARKPAWQVERQREWDHLTRWSLAEAVREGAIPPVFHESDDPNRMVPVVCKPDDFMIAVTGDITRNNAYVFTHNGQLGYPVGKRIDLPSDWPARMARFEL